jgi:hypothetical protein
MQKGTDWGGSYSRFSFDELKRYAAMLKEQGKVVLDDEFNVAQEILHTLGRRLVQDGFGDGAVGNGWKIVGTGASNNFTITGGDGTAAGAGHVYVNGILAILPSNITYSAQEIAGPALTTPSGARVDEVYVDLWLDEYGPADDAAITDPTLGVETSRRLRVMYMVRVAEGGVTPANYVDATGITHYTRLLARINRTATAAINSGMVVDARPKFTWDRANIDYVLSQASIVPARADDTQLYDALVVLIAALVPPVPTATTAVQGKVELATDAETQAGTDATRAVTPASLFAAAVSAATANRIVRRDAAGRAQMVAPAAASDIAIKSNVDAVQASVNNHAAATTDVHGVGGSTVESAAGAQAKVNAHAALTNPHSATSAATASRLILRDAAGRAQVAAPSAAADIARKDTVDALIPAGTKMVFAQATAPTGWTQDTSVNDRVMRVVSGSGGGVGGSWTISGLTVGDTALTIAQMPLHGHAMRHKTNVEGQTGSDNSGPIVTRNMSAVTEPAWTGAPGDAAGQSIGGTGGGQAHTHGLSSNGAWRPNYVDVIVASRN